MKHKKPNRRVGPRRTVSENSSNAEVNHLLAVGLLGGYIIRPDVNNPVSSNGTSGTNPTGLTNPPIDPNAAASRQEMTDFLVSQTRHMRGDPDAPVAIIEFSDFQ